MRLKNPLKQKLSPREPDAQFKAYLDFYLKQGLSVIPLAFRDKKPAVDSWGPYTKRRATPKEIEGWFYHGVGVNIGIICGEVSNNLVVLDFEDKKIAYKLFGKNIGKETFAPTSGSGKGLHVYFFTRFPVRKFKIPELALDVQGNGSYVAAPPSIHPNGNEYKPEKGTVPIAHWTKGEGDFEEDLYEFIKNSKKFKDFNGHKHRQPIDAEKLLREGVNEGQRNQATIWLATWFRRANKKQEECEEELKIWNSKLKEPLPESELLRTIDSAYKRETPYNYWYKQSPEAYKEIEQFSKEEAEEAEKILQSEEILPNVEYALDEIVGEKKNKMSLFLLELANQSVQVGAQSSTGKNFTVDRVMELFPKDHILKITGTTDKAIRYLPDRVGTLYVAEWRATGKRDEESTAQFDLKLVISEGKLAVLTVVKDKDEGKWVTQTQENKNIKNIITTTTDIEIPDEYRTRVWHISLDETSEQTARIAGFKTSQAALPPSKRLAREKEKKILRYAIKKAMDEAPEKYIIPFMPQLIKIFDTNKVRVRRDTDKLELAIYATAKLHYRNRPRFEGALVCLPQDFYWAWQYMDKAILGTFSEKEERFMEHWKLAERILDAGKQLNTSTYAKIIDKSERMARNWLNRFAEAGLLTREQESKRLYIYRRATQAQNQRQTIEISMKELYDVTEDWFNKYKEEFERENGNRKSSFDTRIFLEKTLSLSLPDFRIAD